MCKACAAKLAQGSELRERELPGGGVVVSLFDFGQPLVRELLHNLKYNGIYDIGPVVGELAGEAYLRGVVRQRLVDLVDSERLVLVPVPVTGTKRKQRGYNQAEVLAKGLSGWLGVEVESKMLVRQGKRKSQVGRGRTERAAGLAGEFSARNEVVERWQGYAVVVLDDLVTTGSTLEVCLGVLQERGYKAAALTVGFED